jgi:hypothetical protein
MLFSSNGNVQIVTANASATVSSGQPILRVVCGKISSDKPRSACRATAASTRDG